MTGLLLDSNALVWWMLDRDVLAPAARDMLLNAREPAAVSVASIWELEMKRQAGKLDLSSLAWEDVEQSGFDVLGIDLADAVMAARLPRHHRDPFDRMIVAQALNRGLMVVTRDKVFAEYGVSVLAA